MLSESFIHRPVLSFTHSWSFGFWKLVSRLFGVKVGRLGVSYSILPSFILSLWCSLWEVQRLLPVTSTMRIRCPRFRSCFGHAVIFFSCDIFLQGWLPLLLVPCKTPIVLVYFSIYRSSHAHPYQYPPIYIYLNININNKTKMYNPKTLFSCSWMIFESVCKYLHQRKLKKVSLSGF